MDTARWNRLKDLFDQALDRPVHEREAFVEHACTDDPHLLSELKSLLTEEDSVLRILDGVAVDAAGVLDDLDEKGKRIGPYILVRQLGTGGMGHVYLAERADGQFERQVALKLVKSGIQSDRLLARFRSERRILGRLEHPNIAAMLDAGITDAGRPYFVLEYVEGKPIDQYANQNQLDVDARLELFDQVCRAVTYAHANLVVHRDLKPSNILVTDNGQVKLLDFGIAKVLSEKDSTGEPLTKAGAALMTPAYASPEQARGEPVTTSSDIYSLGVVLYELLAGLRPYEVDRDNLLESARIICDVEPERPSTRVASATTTGSTHGTQPGRLSRLLSGDLDVICLKALRKEPERRYTTSDELREDLRRFLNDEPISARAESRRYRMGKFLHRHQAGVGAAAAVVLIIAGLIGYYTDRLSDEAHRARLEAEKARQVAEFVQEAFSVPNPLENQGETLTARQVLDQGAARLEERLAQQPEVLAEMFAVIARSYYGLGLYESAAQLQEKALTLNTEIFGLESEAVASSLNEAGSNYRMLGDYEKADSLFGLALEIRRSLHGDVHDEVATSLNNVGLLAETLGKYSEAESLLTEGLEIRLALYGPDEPDLAVLYNNLGRVNDRLGDYRAALRNYDEALRLLEIELDPPHPHMAIALKNKADTQRKLGRYAASDSTYGAVLRMTDELYDPDHPRRANVLVSRARVLIELGEIEEATDHLAESERIFLKTFGSDHPQLMGVWSVRSRLEARSGNYQSADSLRRKLLEMNRERFGDQSYRVATDLAMLSELQLQMGQPAEAEASTRQAMAIHRKVYGDDHPAVAGDLHRLAECLFAQGRDEEAQRLASEALSMRVEFLGEEHPDVAETRTLLGR